jgi:hypothetical protein
MRAKEFEPKPRNFVAKNAKMGGAGAHKDKKKAEKQGDLKHKKSLVPMESVLRDKEDLQAKRKALQDLSMNKDVDQKAVQQRKLDLEKEAKKKDMTEAGYQHGFADPKAPDLGSQDKRDFKRAELQHELGNERNNIAVSINGKLWKVFRGKGTADSFEERQYLNHMRSWAEKKSAASGKKWSVGLTGAEPTA